MFCLLWFHCMLLSASDVIMGLGYVLEDVVVVVVVE